MSLITTHHELQLWNKYKYDYDSWKKSQVFNVLNIPTPPHLCIGNNQNDHIHSFNHDQ